MGASGVLNLAEIYDPISDAWSPGPVGAPGLAGHTASGLPDGSIVIAGGEDGAENVQRLVYVYEPDTGDSASGVFRSAGLLNTARMDHGAAVLLDGRLWVGGGRVYSNEAKTATTDLASAEILDVKTSLVTAAASLAVPRSGFAAYTLPNNGQVLIAGGSSAGTALDTAALYRPWTDSYPPVSQLSTARAGAAGAPLEERGYAMVAGGGQASSELFGFATVKTDKSDYAPGEIVIMEGSGWVPDELVRLTIQRVGGTPPDYTEDVRADEFGNVYWAIWAPTPDDVGLTLDLTMVGAKSQARARFTDATKAWKLAISPTSSAISATQTYTLTATNTGSGPPSAP